MNESSAQNNEFAQYHHKTVISQYRVARSNQNWQYKISREGGYQNKAMNEFIFYDYLSYLFYTLSLDFMQSITRMKAKGLKR